MKKQKGSVLLLIACILSYIMVVGSAILFILFAFNIAGISDAYARLVVDYVGGNVNADEQVTMMCVEFVLVALVDLYFANVYLKGYKFRMNSKQYGKMLISKGVFQMLLSSFIPGLFALIAGARMYRRKNAPETFAEKTPEYVNNYKLEAMSEAVTRLKELRDKGAISEEEYYATLNKILES